MKAHCMIREQPWYRREAFVAGLRNAGHEVVVSPPVKADKNTLLVIWNRYGENNYLAERVEQAGGKVIVAENGYIGAGGGTPKFQVHPAGPSAEHYYALALGWHNGGGVWNVGAGDRWSALGVEIRPWRFEGEYILVCPNRSFGVPGRMMPTDWAEKTKLRLERETKMPVRIRAHPGNHSPKRPLAQDLAGAFLVVVWSSSCGVHALVDGIPVICEAPYWICRSAAPSLAGLAHTDSFPNREHALHRLAWAQWTVAEISSGEPFSILLS